MLVALNHDFYFDWLLFLKSKKEQKPYYIWKSGKIICGAITDGQQFCTLKKNNPEYQKNFCYFTFIFETVYNHNLATNKQYQILPIRSYDLSTDGGRKCIACLEISWVQMFKITYIAFRNNLLSKLMLVLTAIITSKCYSLCFPN
jgi:hypothetical protein